MLLLLLQDGSGHEKPYAWNSSTKLLIQILQGDPLKKQVVQGTVGLHLDASAG